MPSTRHGPEWTSQEMCVEIRKWGGEEELAGLEMLPGQQTHMWKNKTMAGLRSRGRAAWEASPQTGIAIVSWAPAASVIWSGHSKVPQTGWLTRQGIIFLTVLKARSPRSRCHQDWFLVRALVWLSFLSSGSPFSCASRESKQAAEFRLHIRTPTPPLRPPLILTTF